MKRIILSVVLLVTCLSAFEITVLGGGNHQAWTHEGEAFLDGISWHAGGLLSHGLTLPWVPITFSGEAGIIYQLEKYDDINLVYDDSWVVIDTGASYWRYHNLIFPVHLKGVVDIKSRFNLGAGTGLSIVHPLAGKVWNEPEDKRIPSLGKLERDEMDTYLAWQIKGEAGVRIAPKLWIKAAVTGQYKIADLNEQEFVDKRSIFLSLGLAFKL